MRKIVENTHLEDPPIGVSVGLTSRWYAKTFYRVVRQWVCREVVAAFISAKPSDGNAWLQAEVGPGFTEIRFGLRELRVRQHCLL